MRVFEASVRLGTALKRKLSRIKLQHLARAQTKQELECRGEYEGKCAGSSLDQRLNSALTVT
jgi:hypothetical protein